MKFVLKPEKEDLALLMRTFFGITTGKYLTENELLMNYNRIPMTKLTLEFKSDGAFLYIHFPNLTDVDIPKVYRNGGAFTFIKDKVIFTHDKGVMDVLKIKHACKVFEEKFEIELPSYLTIDFISEVFADIYDTTVESVGDEFTEEFDILWNFIDNFIENIFVHGLRRHNKVLKLTSHDLQKIYIDCDIEYIRCFQA